mgnify:CR=1 FL=1
MSYKRLASVLKTSYKRSKTQKVVYVIATQTTFCLSFSLMISTNSQGDRSSAGDWPRVAVAKPKRYFVIMLLCYYKEDLSLQPFLQQHNITIFVYETYSKKPKDTTSPFPLR